MIVWSIVRLSVSEQYNIYREVLITSNLIFFFCWPCLKHLFHISWIALAKLLGFVWHASYPHIIIFWSQCERENLKSFFSFYYILCLQYILNWECEESLKGRCCFIKAGCGWSGGKQSNCCIAFPSKSLKALSSSTSSEKQVVDPLSSWDSKGETFSSTSLILDCTAKEEQIQFVCWYLFYILVVLK